MNPNLQKFVLVFSFVIGASYLCFLHNGSFLFGIDDANIYFVYMRHLAQGAGFVYTAGGEHVEGFTSMLWCIWGALLFTVFGSPEILLLLTNILFISYCLWRLVCFVDNYFSDKRILSPNTLFLFFVLFLFPGYFEWTILSLIETGFWSGLLILGVLNLLHWPNSPSPQKLNIEFCMLLVLLAITRPESLLYAPVMAGIRFVQMLRGSRLSFRNVLWALYPTGIFLLAAIGLTVFRLWYFGYPFPNTYYAKVSQDFSHNLTEGWRYLKDAVQQYLPLVYFMLPVFLLGALTSRTQKQRQMIGIALCLFGLMVLVPLYSGGDHFSLGRVLQPTLPLLYACAGIIIRERLPFRSFYPPGKYALLVLVCVAGIALYGNPKNRYRYGNGSLKPEFEIALYGQILGKQFSQFFAGLPRYPSQGVMTAGAFAYYYQGETADMLGLNNVAMAHADKVKSRGLTKNHASFNKTVFFEQQPDIMWLIPPRFYEAADSGKVFPPEDAPEYKKDWFNAVYKEIAYDERFRGMYSPTCIFKEGESRWILAHVNKRFITNLSQPPFHCVVLAHGK